uniref:Gag protein n=1 Tax=Pitica errantivirus TaxID=3078414 RepID=A0AB38Z250_9VIRU
MPKIPKIPSALKKTRHLLSNVLQNNNCDSSDSEESSNSSDSGDFAHIPIESTPSLENLCLEEKDDMEEIAKALTKITEQMEEFAKKQTKHDDMFLDIHRHLNGESSSQFNHTPYPAPTADPTLHATNFELLFKIPDPIKMIPTFDGNAKQLNVWLATAEDTLNAFKDHVSPLQFKMYVTAVISKIQGKARDTICIAGNPDNFDVVKEILLNSLGDRQELSTYKCQLWQFKMHEKMSIHKYYEKSKEIVQNIKSLAKQNEKYRKNWDAINDFIEEDALAAFIAGLNEHYFGYAQAAGPKDVEAAYAFLCKFRSKEIMAHGMTPNNKTKKQLPQTRDSEKKFNNPNKYQRKENTKDEPEPMDTSTTRSRLTINRRPILNNHETTKNDSEDEQKDDERTDAESDDDLDLNFHIASATRKPV